MRILLHDSSRYAPLNPYFAEPVEELTRKGACEFRLIDEAEFFPRSSLAMAVLRKTFGEVSSWRRQRLLNKRLTEVAHALKPDLILVLNGKFVAPATLRNVQATSGAILANYATDDPWNSVVTTKCFRQGAGLYDIYATPKKAVVPDLVAAGSKVVLRTLYAYKPSVHFPEPAVTSHDRERYSCDVAFIGSCDPDRIDYFHALVRELPQIRLHIYGGGGWERYPALRPYVKGVVFGREFRVALASTKIALNFIRHSNRDDHSERTFQIPACGAFMLAERTDEQLKLLTEGEQAAYFETPRELVGKVAYYLDRNVDRKAIALGGHHRVTTGANTCMDRLLEILDAASQMLKPERTKSASH
jgi:hypothetical protein